MSRYTQFRYIHAIAYAFIALVGSYIAFAPLGIAAFAVYRALIEWFPSIFHDYSPVLDAYDYSRAALTVTVIACALAIYVTSLIVTRLDNGRDEYIIKKTEGFYSIPSIMPTYYKSYAIPDLIASAVITLVISAMIVTAQLVTFPRITWFSRALDSFGGYHLGVLYSELGYLIAPFAVFVLFYTAKLLAGIHGLKKWRAGWLAFN